MHVGAFFVGSHVRCCEFYVEFTNKEFDMAKIRLFGLTLAINNSGKVEKPNLSWVRIINGSWNVELKRNRRQIVIDCSMLLRPMGPGAGRLNFSCNLLLSIQKIPGTNNYEIKPGAQTDVRGTAFCSLQRNNAPSAQRLILKAGPFFGNTALASGAIFGDPDGFSMKLKNGSDVFQKNSQISPINVQWNRNAQTGILLDLSSAALRVRSEALSGTAGLKIDKYSGGRFSIPLMSADHLIPLVDSIQNRPKIKMVAASPNAVLPLNTDFFDRTESTSIGVGGRFGAPFQARNFALELSLAAQPSDTRMDNIELTSRSSQETLLLESKVLFNANNNANGNFKIKDKLRLAVRLDGTDSPSTLMLHDISAAKIAPQDSVYFGHTVGVEYEGLSSGALYSDIYPNGIRRRRQYDRNYHHDLVRETSFVSLELPFKKMTAPIPGQNYTEIGNAETRQTIRWQFTGPKIKLPFMPVSLFWLKMTKGGQPILQGELVLRAINDHAATALEANLKSIDHETHVSEIPTNPEVPLGLDTLVPFEGRIVDAMLNSTLSRRKNPDNPLRIGGSDVSNRITTDIMSRLRPRALRGTMRLPVDTKSAPVQPNNYRVTRNFGPVTVEFTHKTELPGYVLLRETDKGTIRITDQKESLTLIEGLDRFLIQENQIFPPISEDIIGLIKLRGDRALKNILESENIDVASLQLDSSLQQESWTGLILFQVGVDVSNFEILSGLVGNSINLSYLAVGGAQASDGGGDRRFSYTARMAWENDRLGSNPCRPPNGDIQENEGAFFTRSVDLVVVDNALVYFRTESVVCMRSVMGNELSDDSEMELIGSYDERRKEFSFTSRLSRELQIFPRDLAKQPLKNLYFSGATLISGPKGLEVLVDGRVTLNSFDVFGFRMGANNEKIKFWDFGITIPSNQIGKDNVLPRWLQFRYPTFKLSGDWPQYNLFGIGWLQLKIQGLGIDWPSMRDRDWGHLGTIGNTFPGNFGTGDNRAGGFLIDFRLNFGKMPDLIAGNIKSMMLDFTLGLPFVKDSSQRLPDLNTNNWILGYRAVGFKKFNIDLMRFLAVRADSLSFGTLNNLPRPDGTSVSAMEAKVENLEVDILNTPVLRGIDFSLVAPEDQESPSLLLFYNGENNSGPGKNGIFQIEWALIGRNLTLDKNVAKALISIEAASSESDQQNIRNELQTAYNNKSLLSLDNNNQQVGEWIFAAGMNIFEGMLIAKFLFQDKAYYGIAIRGGLLKEWFGYDFRASVLYIKGQRASEDRFYVEVAVPAIDVGTFRFTGGVVAFEIWVNGSFMLDVGFPWIGSNGRRWERSLGAIITPLQGSGGTYFRYQRERKSAAGHPQLVVGAGYAVQAGVGATFSAGPFRVWVRAGYYAVIEGTALLGNSGNGIKLEGLRLMGAVGALIEGAGELDWWIISARVTIRVIAEARTTLFWGERIFPNDPAPGNDVILLLEFEARASVSARACIGPSWARVCKGIRASVRMGFSERLALGG